jgi:hypothetical protein
MLFHGMVVSLPRNGSVANTRKSQKKKKIIVTDHTSRVEFKTGGDAENQILIK